MPIVLQLLNVMINKYSMFHGNIFDSFQIVMLNKQFWQNLKVKKGHNSKIVAFRQYFSNLSHSAIHRMLQREQFILGWILVISKYLKVKYPVLLNLRYLGVYCIFIIYHITNLLWIPEYLVIDRHFVLACNIFCPRRKSVLKFTRSSMHYQLKEWKKKNISLNDRERKYVYDIIINRGHP